MKTVKLSFLIILLTTLFVSCQKEYSRENAKTPAGTWQFNDGTKLYVGNIDTAYIETTGTTKTLNLVGRSTDGSQNFLLHLYATDSFTVGVYKASLFQTDFEYFTQAKTIYQADQFIGEFTVNVTAIGNNQITGTFAGAAEDSTSTVTALTLGQFTSRIDLSTNGTGGGGSGTASGTLGASAGVCTPVTPSGTYTQGIALTSTNTVQVQVNVTTPGTYTISTNIVNGVTFSRSGTFTATGLQNVILNGTGTPINSGAQNFTVTFGSSTCDFPITFLPGVPPTDYFPTTVNSFWDYGKQGGTPSDSFKIKVIPYTLSAGGQSYSTFTLDDIPASGSPDSLYYRKGAGLYYEYFNTDDFFGFDAGTGSPQYVEYIFLKDNVPQGTSWNSPNINGSYSGTPYTFFIKMTLVEKATTPVTSGSVTSSDVLKMKYEYFVTLSPTIPIATEERWFARGIGMIYYTDDFSGSTEIYNIGYKQVF